MAAAAKVRENKRVQWPADPDAFFMMNPALDLIVRELQGLEIRVFLALVAISEEPVTLRPLPLRGCRVIVNQSHLASNIGASRAKVCVALVSLAAKGFILTTKAKDGTSRAYFISPLITCRGNPEDVALAYEKKRLLRQEHGKECLPKEKECQILRSEDLRLLADHLNETLNDQTPRFEGDGHAA